MGAPLVLLKILLVCALLSDSDPAHEAIAQGIFLQCDAENNVIQNDMMQLYCSGCKRWSILLAISVTINNKDLLLRLADRYVEGTCPKCGDPGARGDQCDACGNCSDATDLINPRCAHCSTPPETKSSRHLFLDLPKLTTKLTEYVRLANQGGYWSDNTCSVTDAWLKMGLNPRCISRDLKWGTPVPKEGFNEKVFYVWFDAPIGYISITASYTPEWRQWWQNPRNVELVQFMGKDNIPFHTVIFPSSLIGTKLSLLDME